MFHSLKKHLQDNSGDANVSKMTMIGIIFVVGAICLVLVTTAFRNPINRWFSNVTNGWFDSANGEFNLMDNPFVGYERHENGVYKDLEYVYVMPDGKIRTISTNHDLIENGITSITYVTTNANGSRPIRGIASGATVEISPDGRTITVNGDVFEARIPE